MIAGLAALLAAGAVATVFVLAHRAATRLERVRGTANAIAQGHRHVRTGMAAHDEIGAVGKAVDTMANALQYREDQMRVLLTRERRERFYMTSVLESMSDGVIVQDAIGAVLMMNEPARLLLGTLATFNPFAPTTEAARQVLGDALAPGLYSLGDPQQVSHKGTMLSAQAAAVLSPNKERLGTVTILRDVTEQVRKDQLRDAMMAQLQHEIEPLHDTVAIQRHKETLPAADFAREIARHAAALQKMIVDMRELTQYASHDARAMQRLLSVETLLWSVANDWRQIAMAANLTLQVTVNRKGLLILGDEGRLRLALGNLVDNAIKYTPSGGMITLEIERETDSTVHLRIRDNGVGVSDADLPQLFVPFYRGTPIDTSGQVVRVPGMGQGLAIAKQIIEAHGGKIKVKSRAGAGTAVYLSLPLTAGVGGNVLSGEAMFMEGDTVVISVPRTTS
jgi:signal transduction histidine kinase